MRKNEIAKAKDNDLITEYAVSYATMLLNYNLGRGMKQIESHCRDLEEELFKRGLLTEENLKRLRA